MMNEEQDHGGTSLTAVEAVSVSASDPASHAAPTHTPGQWVAECCTLAEAQADGGFTWAHSVPDWTPHTRVGSVWQVASPSGMTGLPGSIEVSEANAHLIAAAPELYEALKSAIEILKIVDVDALGIGQGPDGETWPLLAEYLHGMRAALTKAEGRDRQPSIASEIGSVPSAAQK